MLLLTKSTLKYHQEDRSLSKEVKDGVLGIAKQWIPDGNWNIIGQLGVKSEDEQDVLIDSFQNFLNSLSIPLQILIRVREVDIDSYLEKIQQKKLTKKKKFTNYKSITTPNLSKN